MFQGLSQAYGTRDDEAPLRRRFLEGPGLPRRGGARGALPEPENIGNFFGQDLSFFSNEKQAF